MASKVEEQLRRAREKAEKEFEIAEKERKKKLLQRRVQLANEGARAFEAGKWLEAMRSFHTYIQVLENWKNVPEGGLHPNLFDRKHDVTELLLISGVYWDMTKLYDRTKTKKKEFQHHLNKYVLFSKNMPFQPMCSEAVRRYIANKKCMNKSDFRRAYRELAVSKCFVASALVEELDLETLPRLRDYRDLVLARSAAGRGFIRFYYAFGPLAALGVRMLPREARRALARTLKGLAQRIRTGSEA